MHVKSFCLKTSTKQIYNTQQLPATGVQSGQCLHFWLCNDLTNQGDEVTFLNTFLWYFPLVYFKASNIFDS